MAKLERGFGAAANRIALGLRIQSNLSMTDPLDPKIILEKRGIKITGFSDYKNLLPNAVKQLEESNDFSAMLLSGDNPQIVVHNDSHSPGRQASNLSHELAHHLLTHPGNKICSGNLGQKTNSKAEAEASYLGGCILIPNEAAHRIAVLRTDHAEAAEHYGVSEEMIEYRLRMSGAYKIAKLNPSSRG